MNVNSRNMREIESLIDSSYDERLQPSLDVHRGPRSPHAIRPCYYILQILGMWKPSDGKFEFAWRVYRIFIFIVWFACLTAIMCLDFVHYGFDTTKIHFREIMNSFCTCLVFLCPFIFSVYYLSRGQFVELVFSVQGVSQVWHKKLSRVAKGYTFMSLCLWGWWATWLSIYGFVCHVHSLQIDTVVEEMKSMECTSRYILYKHSIILSNLERTQKDFGVIISLALAYHAFDMIIFSFAYFNSAFGQDYPLWQFMGTVIYDLISIIVKLYPPAVVAAASHRIVVQACKRCQARITPTSTDLPSEDMQVFQYMSWCEKDMGLKILGIPITVELAMKIFMTIITVVVSFVAFVIPRLK
ncbi:uncharacterized protein [Montipora foliosa]|uniref:uncharacterized protein n=1 Tax=Montipora foliosa TaxID=591990 RepID=UPI0035F17BEA